MTAVQEKLVKDILDSKGDLAQLLGISADSTFADIKKRYRKLAVQVHPDKNPAKDASKAFQLLQQTYDQAETYLKLRDQQQKVNATASVHTQGKETPAKEQQQQQQQHQQPRANNETTSTAAFFFSCPNCKQRLRTFTEYVNMTFNCLGCGHSFKMQKNTDDGASKQATPTPTPVPTPKPNLSCSEDDFTSSSSSFSSSEDEVTTPAPPPPDPAPTATHQHEPVQKEPKQPKRAPVPKGPWTCTKCTALCLSRRVKCGTCGAPRPGMKKRTSKTRATPAATAAPASTPSEPSAPPAREGVTAFQVGKEVEVRRKDGRWMKCIIKDVDTAQQYYVVEGKEEGGTTWSKMVSFAGTREVAEVYKMGQKMQALRQNGKWAPCAIKDVDYSAEIYTLQGVSESGAVWTKGISFAASVLCLRKATPEARQSAEKPLPSQPAGQPAAKPATTPWNCKKCLLPNKAKSVKCKMCGTAKPSSVTLKKTAPAPIVQEKLQSPTGSSGPPTPSEPVRPNLDEDVDDIKPIPLPKGLKKSKPQESTLPEPVAEPIAQPAEHVPASNKPLPPSRSRSNSSAASSSSSSSSSSVSLPTVPAAKVNRRTTLPKIPSDDEPAPKRGERTRVAEDDHLKAKLKEAEESARQASTEKQEKDSELQKLRKQLEEQKKLQAEILTKREREKEETEKSAQQAEKELREKVRAEIEAEQAKKQESMEEMRLKIEMELKNKLKAEMAEEYEKKMAKAKEQVEAERARIIAEQREAAAEKEQAAARQLAVQEEEAARQQEQAVKKLAEMEQEIEQVKADKDSEIQTLEREREIVKQEAMKKLEDRAREAEEELKLAKVTYENQLRSREGELLEIGQKELEMNRNKAEEELREKQTAAEKLQMSISTLQQELQDESEKGRSSNEEKLLELKEMQNRLENVTTDKAEKEQKVALLEDDLAAAREKAVREREDHDMMIQVQQEAIAKQTANLEMLQRETKRKAKLQEAEERIREEQEKRKERDVQRKLQQAMARERLQTEIDAMQVSVMKLQIEGSELSENTVVEAALRGKKQLEGQLAELEQQVTDQEEREGRLQELMQETAEAYKKASDDANVLRQQSTAEQTILTEKLSEARKLLEQEKECAAFFADQLQMQRDEAKSKAKRDKQDAKKLTEEERLASENFSSQLQLAETEGAKHMRKVYEKELKEAKEALDEEKQCAAFFAQQLQEQRKQIKKLESMQSELEEEKKCAEFFANEVTNEKKKRRDMEKVAEILAQGKNEQSQENIKQLSLAKQQTAEAKAAYNDAVADRLTEEKKKDKELKKLQQNYDEMKKKAETPIYIPVVQVAADTQQIVAPQQTLQIKPASAPLAIQGEPKEQEKQPAPSQEEPAPEPPQSVQQRPRKQKAQEPKIIMPALPKLVRADESQVVALPELPVVEDSSPPPPPPPPPGASSVPVQEDAPFDSDSSNSDSDDEFMKLAKILPKKAVPRVCPFPDSDDDTYGYETGTSSPLFNTSFQGITFKDREGRALFRCPYCDVGFPEEMSSIDLPASCPTCYSPFLLLSSMIVMMVDDDEKDREQAREDERAGMRKQVTDAIGTYNNELNYEERRRQIMSNFDRQENLFVLGETDNSRAEALIENLGKGTATAPQGQESYEQKKARVLKSASQTSKSTFIDDVVATEVRRHEDIVSRCACGVALKGACIHCEDIEAPQHLDPSLSKQLCPCGSAEVGRCIFCDD